MRSRGVVMTVMLVAVALFGLTAPSEGTEKSSPILPGQPGFSLWADNSSPTLLAQAQRPAPPRGPAEEPWRFRLTPYLWAPGLDVDFRGNSFDKDFSDVIEDADLGYAGHLELSRGPWTILGDINVLRIEKEKPDVGIGFDFKTTIGEVAVAYRLGPPPAPAGGVAFELLAGVRYLRLDIEVTGSAIPGEHDKSKAAIDPIVGGRVVFALSEPFTLWARADVGGFNISDSQTKLTFNVLGGVDWRIVPALSLFAGWRFMSIDANAIDAEVELSGPFLGLTLIF